MTEFTLGIAVKSTAGTAAVDLDKLTLSAGKAERGVRGLEGASRASATALQPVTTMLAGIDRNASTAAAGLGRVSAASTMIKTSATSAATAIGQEAAMLRSATDAIARNTVAANANAAARRSMGNSFNTANVAAQFQDIGVTAAMGMSPLQIALQQGTQLSAVLGGQGLTGVVKTLGAAFASVLSPVSLLTIGAVALGAAGLQALGGLISSSSKAKNGIDSITQALAEQAGPIDSIKGRISELESITDAYAKAIRGTAKDQSIATAAIIANSEREFNAKKSLLELELKRQRAAIAVGEAEMAIAGRDLAREVRSSLPPSGIVDPVAGGFSDPKIGQFVRSPQQSLMIERTQAAISASPINDQIKEMAANLELARIGVDGLDDALGTTFDEGVATSIGRVASSTSGAKTAAEKAAEKYSDLIRLAQQRIDMAGVEQSTIGMTTEAIARMTIEQEMLNKAANDNINLTPRQTQEIERLAAGIAAAEEQTRRLGEAYDFTKGVFTGIGQDFLSGFRDRMGNADEEHEASRLKNISDLLAEAQKDGEKVAIGQRVAIIEMAKAMADAEHGANSMERAWKSAWESMGDAAVNALDKMASKAMDMAMSGIFDMLFGAVMGGITGGLAPGGAGFLGGGASSWGPSFAGGGYTGDGSRSGGIDGMGGFPAVLHPRETVTDHTRGQPANQNGGGSPIAITNTFQVMPGATEADGAALARGVTNELRRQLPDAMKAVQRNDLRRAS